MFYFCTRGLIRQSRCKRLQSTSRNFRFEENGICIDHISPVSYKSPDNHNKILILINNDNEDDDYDNNNDDDNQDNVMKDNVAQLTAQTYWEKKHPGCSQ